MIRSALATRLVLGFTSIFLLTTFSANAQNYDYPQDSAQALERYTCASLNEGKELSEVVTFLNEHINQTHPLMIESRRRRMPFGDSHLLVVLSQTTMISFSAITETCPEHATDRNLAFILIMKDRVKKIGERIPD